MRKLIPDFTGFIFSRWAILPIFSEFLDLTKFRLSVMVILTAAVGLFLAPGMESISFSYGLICLLGIAILVMGSCVANCYVEREEDKKMRRTQNRALPSGRVSPRSALILSLSMIVFSLVTLAWAINLLTAFLGLWACILYVFVYTPLKSKSTMALFIGAIPGALPPVLGWTSVTGSLDWWPLILFAYYFFLASPPFYCHWSLPGGGL